MTEGYRRRTIVAAPLLSVGLWVTFAMFARVKSETVNGFTVIEFVLKGPGALPVGVGMCSVYQELKG
jgi:hypothetical protein